MTSKNTESIRAPYLFARDDLENMLVFNSDHFDPLQVFLRLNPAGPGFLESLGDSTQVARYSIVPLSSRESWQLGDGDLTRTSNGETEQLPGDPFSILAQVLSERAVARQKTSPFPGGYFGYFSYDLAGKIEQLPQKARRDLPVPKLWLTWVDAAVVYDHASGQVILDSLNPDIDLNLIKKQLERCLEEDLAAAEDIVPIEPQPVLSREEFMRRVEKAREYIAAGDIYQANLSCRFDAENIGDLKPEVLYQQLRQVNPSPFACLFRSPHVDIISSSPERLVSLRDGIAETRPIAGTRPRGFTVPEDSRLGEELLAHPKERAEHIMLLDLERNDLGKVCQTGSVEVDELMVLERYSHVTHIVSNVKGKLKPDMGPFDLIKATFPGGTITGVPKKRCMEIIDELEPVGRGTYTGSAGYISATGEMDLNILIRTFQLTGDKLTYQVGAGIVADSDPANEWDECMAKGEALRMVLENK